MRKILIFALMMASALFMTGGALSEAAAIPPLEGVIAQVMEDGSFLLEDTAHGQVLVNVDENTTLENVDVLIPGQYVFVWYSGAMTKSLPPQATAERVACFVLEGLVMSADEAAGTALMDSEEFGQVLVHLPEGTAALKAGDYLVAYYSGVMAMSYPGQVGGLKVDVYVLAQGTVTEIGDGYFLMEGGVGAIRVNVGEETQIPEYLEEGDEVTVYYNGVMTRSIPPQVFGLIVELDMGE